MENKTIYKTKFKMNKANNTGEWVWVVSLDRDSFNYVPVEHPKQKVLDHNKKCPSDEIVEFFDDQEECQERCNQINSL